jgi:hypothetical protein
VTIGGPSRKLTRSTRTPLAGGVELQQGWHYDIARDGRFLVDTVMDSAAAPITLLMNWNPNAKRQPRGPDKSSLVA